MRAPRPTVDRLEIGEAPLPPAPAPLVLEKLSWYRDGSDELRSEIRSSVVETRIPQGSHFYIEGGRCAGFAIVGAGRLRVYKSAETPFFISSLLSPHVFDAAPVQRKVLRPGVDPSGNQVVEATQGRFVTGFSYQNSRSMSRKIQVSLCVEDYTRGAFPSIRSAAHP